MLCTDLGSNSKFCLKGPIHGQTCLRNIVLYKRLCPYTIRYSFVNRTNLVSKFSQYIYCFSLHVSGNYVPIIRRKYRTYATPGICHFIYRVTQKTGTFEKPNKKLKKSKKKKLLTEIEPLQLAF